ncbi:MAG: phosphotransferase [Anaerolineaceae bacterium]|nr:phosphotransferase [Anaerolineaceae bacterium]
MEDAIKSRFNDMILREAARRFGVLPSDLELLDGFESFMYAFERDDTAYILRIGHSLRRSAALIQGEVDWINYLVKGGVGASRAITSGAGNLVEHVADGMGGDFLATAFVKANGNPPGSREWADPAFFKEYGRTIGRMHALTQQYILPDPAWKRPQWDAPVMAAFENLVMDLETVIRDHYLRLKAHIDTLPRDDPQAYGLIHQDAHTGNCFVDDAGRITFFDFDDCVYSWFINDIAIVLFYAIPFTGEREAFTARFMPEFLQGYAGENQLAPHWLKEIPHFLKLREIDLFAIINSEVDLSEDSWAARYMAGRRERLEKNVPYVDYDFESLAEYLA